MNIKSLLILFLLLTGACTAPVHDADSHNTREWQENISQLTTLLHEKKRPEAISLARQQMQELLKTANTPEPGDSVILYARQLLNIFHNI